MPLVSIIMNCYNSDCYLREALDSIYGQTFKDYEIIFWDNQSTDQSAEIAKSYGEPLRYFRADKFLPLGGARTEAVKRANGKYITFLDCDDIWLSQKLERQIVLIEQNPEIDFIYSNYFILKENQKYIALGKNQPEGFVFGQFFKNFTAATLTVLLKKEFLDQMDSLFESNLSFAMDFDVFMRYLYNRKASYISDPLAIYRVHSQSTSSSRTLSNVKEIKFVTDKLREQFSEIETTYHNEIVEAEKKQEFAFAWGEMKAGNFKAARKYIAPYKWHTVLYFVHYVGTFMPVTLWKFLCSTWYKLKSLKDL